MARIRVQCPECKQHLAFEGVPGYQNMIVVCPKCGFRARANVYMAGRYVAPPNPIIQNNNSNPEKDTEIYWQPSSAAKVGQIRVKSTGEIQYLKEGRNIIGRRAQSGNADIKISNDRYMSRRHIAIDVVPKGNGYEHLLVEIGSTNLPWLNKRKLQRNDILILKFGDVITLGQTDVIFESDDNDETRKLD